MASLRASMTILVSQKPISIRVLPDIGVARLWTTQLRFVENYVTNDVTGLQVFNEAGF
jgi:hypothetical protein